MSKLVDSGVSKVRGYSPAGEVRWELVLPFLAPFSKPLLFKDGKLVFVAPFGTPKEEYLVAIQTPSPGLAKTIWPRAFHDNQNSRWAGYAVP